MIKNPINHPSASRRSVISPRHFREIIFLAFLVLHLPSVTPALAQKGKIPLTHDVYDGWKNIFRQQVSPDGRWVTWEANPQEGDGMLYISDLRTGSLDSVARGNRAEISPNSSFMGFYLSPPSAVIRRGKAEGLTEEQMPRDSVGIYVFDRGSNNIAGRAGSFAVAREKSDFMIYLLRVRPAPGEQAPSGIARGESQAGGTAGGAASGQPADNTREARQPATTMHVFNPVTGENYEFHNVNEYSFSRNGRLVAFVQSPDIVVPAGGNSAGRTERTVVSVFNTVTKKTTLVLDAPGKAISVATCAEGSRAAFLYRPSQAPAGGSPDATGSVVPVSEPATWDLWYWEEGYTYGLPAVTAATTGMPEGWGIRENGTLSFSEDGSRLWFGTAERPEGEPKDTLLDEERYKVDIWNWRDPMIQPQQLVELRNEQRRSYPAVYHTAEKQMVQVATPEVPEVTTGGKGNNRYEMGTSTLPYLVQNSFESGNYADVYLIDVYSGERRKVVEKYRGSSHATTLGDARLSPEGKYLLWYSQADSNWHAMPAAGDPVFTRGESDTRITGFVPVPLYNELYDQPSAPGPYGAGVWTENDEHVMIYDRFDIWKVDPSGKEPPVNLTGGYGRANNIQFRYVSTDSQNENPGRRDQVMLSAFDLHRKQSGFYTVRMHRPAPPSELTMADARYTAPQKARDANVLIWRKGAFEEFPDLWTSNTNFRNTRRLSRANPQQSRYRWGTAEIVEWESPGNDTLQGILYKPEDMESGKKYPMIVYFYERMSDNLHNHYVPAPSRSTINIPYSVSNGYVVFVPDIPYTTGFPGQSAYNAIVSGTRAMIERHGFIDSENIGIQGQSWAGYQIAWLVTRTGMFRAAMAGAPVTNMTSAYGGIRWATGLSRIYQYEETQSRIGGTLWEMPQRYIENSPVFFADNVSTPLLMMHNDNDGAVPWYQGIEFYMALRRLGKPAWMLNYNGEAHNLTRRPNMMDLSVRMYQYFGHYLKGEPAPVWMEEGIPAVRKGKIDGYELVK